MPCNLFINEGGGDWPRMLWIICYRKTRRLVFVLHSSILITLTDHIILNEAVTLMRELIFAKTKLLTIERMKFMKVNSHKNRSSFGIQFLIEHGYKFFRWQIYLGYHKEGKDWYICFQLQNCYLKCQSTNKSLSSKKREKWWIGSWLHPEQGLILILFCLGKCEFSVTPPLFTLMVPFILLKISLL